MSNPELLGFLDQIELDDAVQSALQDDLAYADPLPANDINHAVRRKFGVDLKAGYAGIILGHPFGKGAGQLSMSDRHVASDRENGLAFTILKSAVGVTESGDVGIDEWQKSAPKMITEPRVALDGRTGWTVSWKGRGWDKGFDAYVELYRQSLQSNPGYYVIPSLMVDVTDPDRAREQADFCIGRLMEVHESNSPSWDFLVEVDISPTLSLLAESSDQTFAEFVGTSTSAFRQGLAGKGKCIVKLPNAGIDAAYQLQLVKIAIEESGDRLAGIIIGNRLFDRNATFEDQVGISYGGWDLSNANLATLDLLPSENISANLVGTGNICSGRMMAEYAVRGCMSGQLHTFFQLPPDAYRAPKGEGGRTWRAIRELLFDQVDGLVPVLLKLEKAGYLHRSDDYVIRFMDLPGIYSELKD